MSIPLHVSVRVASQDVTPFTSSIPPAVATGAALHDTIGRDSYFGFATSLDVELETPPLDDLREQPPEITRASRWQNTSNAWGT